MSRGSKARSKPEWQAVIHAIKAESRIDEWQQLAAVAGVPPKTVTLWHQGKNAPPTLEKQDAFLAKIRAFASGADQRPMSDERRAGMLHVIKRVEAQLAKMRADLAAVPTAPASDATETPDRAAVRATRTVYPIPEQPAAAAPATKVAGRRGK